jgi:hypothetical protein
MEQVEKQIKEFKGDWIPKELVLLWIEKERTYSILRERKHDKRAHPAADNSQQQKTKVR